MDSYVILMNGPAGIGKTWLCKQLVGLLAPHAERHSLMSIPWIQIKNKYGWTRSYEEFKKYKFGDGFDGRQKIIDYVEEARKTDPEIWCREFKELYEEVAPGIVLIESIGFPIEQAYFVEHFKDVFTVVMSPTHYSPGMQFLNDSRLCLPPSPAGRRFENSTKAFQYFQAAMNHARDGEADPNETLSVDSIWERIKLGRPLESSGV